MSDRSKTTEDHDVQAGCRSCGFAPLPLDEVGVAGSVLLRRRPDHREGLLIW
jgi:hypothetical protein